MHQHTLLVRAKKAKDKAKPYGAFIDLRQKDWRWYQAWLDEVLTYCDENRDSFVADPFGDL